MHIHFYIHTTHTHSRTHKHSHTNIHIHTHRFVVIMIGNVPQGLPTTVTACLFIVAQRMGNHNVFVKKLDIIETLGSCTLICTDKTGTLTQNLMSVANTWFMNTKHDTVSLIEQNTVECQSLSSQSDRTQLRTLIDVAALNSRYIYRGVLYCFLCLFTFFFLLIFFISIMNIRPLHSQIHLCLTFFWVFFF